MLPTAHAHPRPAGPRRAFGVPASVSYKALLLLFAVALAMQAAAHMALGKHAMHRQVVSVSGADSQRRADKLSRECMLSLTDYHKALSEWFTGSSNDFDDVVTRLKLAQAFELRIPTGDVFDKEQTLAALKKLHNTEARGSEHVPTNARVKHASDSSVTIVFAEEQRRRGSDPLTVIIDSMAVCVWNVDMLTGEVTDDVRWLITFEAFAKPAASINSRKQHVLQRL